MRLTIGMATYDDYDGTYFSVQSLRAHHNLTDCEILIAGNKKDERLESWANYWGRYVPTHPEQGQVRFELCDQVVGTSYPRDQVFRQAKGEHVICIDSHVLLLPTALDLLWEGDDLVHGPMCYDDFTYVTHMEDTWNDKMWGVWAPNTRELPDSPFEIPMHGLGLFGCRREAWLGFNPEFRGFGGEEGYIHYKYRKAGRKVMCVPWLKWVHRFNIAVSYPLDMGDRVRNYLLGFKELEMDPQPIYKLFGHNMVERINDGIS